MMYSAYKLNKQVTIYSLDVLLFLFGTSLLFHVQFMLAITNFTLFHLQYCQAKIGV